MTFRKIATRFLQTPPDGSKPWWLQNGSVDAFLWVDKKGTLKLMQCAHQETYRAVECLPNIPEGLREQVARSLEDVRLLVVRSRPVPESRR